MVRYVTNVVDQRLSNDGPDWDGFAEISFASAADARERLFAIAAKASASCATTSRASSGTRFPTGSGSTCRRR